MTVQSAATRAAHLVGQRMPFERIPVVDLEPFLSGRDRARTAAEIGRACREVGFLYVRNHGVAPDLVARIFAVAKSYFDLPRAAKMRQHIKKSPHHRGYFPLFEENTDPDLTADLKEGFDMAMDLGPDDPDVRAGTPLHGPNVWPDQPPEFRAVAAAYYAAMTDLARTLLRSFALALEIDEFFFRDKVSKPLAQLRLLHYPPQTGHVEAKTLGCGAHTDYGCLTILAQDAIGGLQLQNCNGGWIEAPPIPGAFVINVGDQMARWTNDAFPSTPHRVINTSGRERYSIPFFFDPNYDARIECLANCQGPDRPAKYAPVLAGEYLVQRFNDTFKYRAPAS
jgi:isopenicillin N synthase-like dioxygenase